jgi:hypothetical protein
MLSVLQIPVYGQSWLDRHDYEKAEACYRLGQYGAAIELLSRIPPKSDYFVYANLLKSSCFSLTGEFQKALETSTELLRKHAREDVLFAHVFNLNACGQYAELANFIARLPASHQKNVLASRIDSLNRWKTTSCDMVNEAYNSTGSDISPFPMGKGIIFSTNREGVLLKKKNESDGNPYFNLHYAEGGEVKKFSERINTGEHDFAPSLTNRGDTVYFTRRVTQERDKLQFFYFKLYCSERIHNRWSAPYEFILNDTSYSYAYPFLDESNGIFYFASDMPGGLGGWDLYMCIKEDSLWSDPIHLGPSINTKGDEIYPFVCNGSLFFSSNGHWGLGGFDIYKTCFKRGVWQTPLNMKTPINSGADDVSLVFSNDQKTAWFTSNRIGGKGKEDIYRLKATECLFK